METRISFPRTGLLALTISIAAWAGAATAADNQLARLKNLHLGMSMYEVEQLAGDGFTSDIFRCSESSTTGLCTSGLTTVAQIPAQVSLHFVNTTTAVPQPLTSAERRMMSQEEMDERRTAASKELHVAAIRVVINADEHDELLAALRAKYEPPKTASVHQYSNAFGFKVSGASSVWSAGDVSVGLWERCGQIDEACLYIQSARLVGKFKSLDGPRPADRQKDL